MQRHLWTTRRANGARLSFEGPTVGGLGFRAQGSPQEAVVVVVVVVVVAAAAVLSRDFAQEPGS